MKKPGNKIIFGIVIVAILTLSFFWGGNPPSQIPADVADENTEAIQHLTAEEKLAEAEKIAQETYEETPEDIKPVEEPVSDESPEETVTADEAMTCYLSVRCDSILNNLQYLNEDKKDIVPKDGKIYENNAAVIYEGESAFNVLVRELKKNKIHLEYEKTPVYNSAYIEGIGNLYEFDCGELSGWIYKVNGTTPGCGCSQYILKPGDRVEFMYSCNLGIDVGGYKDLTGE